MTATPTRCNGWSTAETATGASASAGVGHDDAVKIDLTVAAIPAFIGAMAAEYAWQRAHPVEPGTRAGDYQLADTVASLSMGVGSLAAPYVAHDGCSTRSPRASAGTARTLLAVGCGDRGAHHGRRRRTPSGARRPRCRIRRRCPAEVREVQEELAEIRQAPAAAPGDRGPAPGQRSGAPTAALAVSAVRVDGADHLDDLGGADGAARRSSRGRRSTSAAARWAVGGGDPRAGTSSTTGTTGSATRAAGCGRCTSSTTPASATTCRPRCASRSPRASPSTVPYGAARAGSASARR